MLIAVDLGELAFFINVALVVSFVFSARPGGYVGTRLARLHQGRRSFQTAIFPPDRLKPTAP